MNDAIELSQVSKIFKNKQAVNKISFQIPQGSITAILGPNGAGKTTTLSMMLGLIKPTSGEIKVLGHSPSSLQVKGRIGAMLQEVSVMDSLRTREVIELVRSYYPHPLTMEELITISRFSQDDLNKFTNKLSGGQKRSLNFTLALSGNPDILFFDEPTVGLDTTARQQFWENTNKLAQRGKTIIFTTHYLQEADDAAHRILLFNEGSLIADGAPSDIKRKLVKRSVSFLPQTSSDDPQLHEQLNTLFKHSYNIQQGRFIVHTDNTDSTLRAIFTEQLPVYDIQVEQGRLDEAFEQLTLNWKGESK